MMLHPSRRPSFRDEQPKQGSVLPGAEMHDVETTAVGDLPELQQHEDWGGPPAIKVRIDSPVLSHELPTKLAVCRTLPILAPEALLPFDMRRARALIIAGVQGVRLGKSAAELQAGGAGIVGGGNSAGGPSFTTSGGGSGGFLCPVGMPIIVVTQSQLWACSVDYGLGNAASLVSVMIDQWAD